MDAAGTATVDEEDELQVTVTAATAAVMVVPVPTTLTLTAPDSVDGGDTLTATVVAEPALPVGTMVNLMVQFGEAIRTVTLSGTTVSVTFMAPPSGLLDLTVSVTGVNQSSPVVTVSAPMPMRVQITELVTVALTLTPEQLPVQDGEPFVMVDSVFIVRVGTNRDLPVGAVVGVTMTFADSLQTARLIGRAASVIGLLDFRATFRAPSTMTGTFELNAFGTPNEITLGALRLMISPATINVMVKPVPISLTLTPISSLDALAGDSVSVEVGTDRPLPTGTVVDVIVQLGSETEMVTLSDMMTTTRVVIPAPLSAGEHQLTASGTVVTQGDLAASVAAAETLTVTVQTEGIVLLTLAAPENVTVGATFMVTVGVNAATPLPEGTEVTVAVISQTSQTADGGEIERQEVMLTPEMPSATRSFTAPATAGSFMLTASGTADTDAIRVVVEASTRVSAEAVALTLILSAPREVTVGSTYQVTVGTDEAVPAGTMLEVTVSAGTEAPQTVMLTEDNPSRAVLFTAPPRADIVTVMATATVDTAPDALQVATPAAATRAVTVSAQQVQLVLSDIPSGLVAAGSTFTVTVGTVSELPADTAVTVTVSLAGGASEPVAVDLTPSNPQASVVVTAPDTGGPALLMATGIPAEDNILELNVLAAETTIVQVQVQVQLSLQLEAPGVVTARDTFAVRVSAEPEVPEGATVTVIVNFDGTDSEPVTLSAGTTSAVVMLTAPDSVDTGLSLTAIPEEPVEVVDSNVLQVDVTPPDVALVNVVPQQVQLMLDVPDEVMTGTDAEVTVSVSPAPLAETTLTVVVTFGESTQQVILSDTTLSQMVSFPALTAALLDVRAEAVAVEPTGGLVVATEAMMQTVQVIELRTLRLNLIGVPENVTVGSTFTVTVGVNTATPPLPANTLVEVMVVFADGTMPVTLRQEQRNVLDLTAPVTAGEFMVEASGIVVATTALRVMVMEDSASVTVEPVAVALNLSGPGEVTVGETYQVMVETDVPEGTTLVVTVSDGTGESETVMLTENNSSENVPFTAPARADTVMVTATVEDDDEDVQTAEGSLEVAVSGAAPLAVMVSALDVQLMLSEILEPVAAGGTFEVIVGTEPEVPAGTTVMATISLTAGGSTTFESESVALTPSAPTARVVVTAPDEPGPAMLTATGVAAADNRLQLNVLAAEAAMVQVQVQVQLSLQLEVPSEVTARTSFEVGVSVAPEVPEDTTVTVTVTFDGTNRESVVLSTGETTGVVTLTAPGRLAENLELSASGSAVVVDRNVLQVNVTPPDVALVNVVPQRVRLALAVPNRVITGDEVEATVSVSPSLLPDTMLTVAVTFGTASTQVTLSDTASSQAVTFTAPMEAQLEMRAVLVVAEPLDLVVAETAVQTVDVRAEGTVSLTLTAPTNVMVGAPFTVTVGVDTNTPLPDSTIVTATLSFSAEEDEERVVVLTSMMLSDMQSFMAPITAGEFTVEVNGTADTFGVTVIGASALVTVEAVAVQLRLGGPAAAVTVGSTYQVTVDTEEPVPEGTAVTVTVSAGTGVPQTVMLTENNSREVPFRAPARAEIVTVMATVGDEDVQTAEGFLEVAVSDAEPLTVNVVAQDVQLVLSELPTGLVVAGSTFLVTVGAEPAVPVGTEVVITASLAGDASEPMTLTASATTAQVVVTAPDTGGLAELTATGEPVAGNRLELNVLAADTEMVQVTELVTLGLTLSPLSTAVETDSTFLVTVGADDAVPAGAEVSVIVTFDESTQAATLSENTQTVVVEFTAPSTAGTFTVEATGTASVEDANALRLTVTPTSASVDVLRLVDLTLSSSPTTDLLPGARVTLTATLAEALSSPVSLTLLATLDGTTPDTVVIDIAADESIASASFLPDSSGDWVFTAEGDSRLIDFAGARVQLTVLPTRLNFSTPPRSLNTDDVLLALRYIHLCRNVAETDCSDPTEFGALDLTQNLGGDYDLDELNRELVVPDLTGDGAGNIADLLIFYRFFNNIPLNRLLTEIPDEDRSILEAIILRAVAPLE